MNELKARPNISLLVSLAFALCMLLIFFIGLGTETDLETARIASNLADVIRGTLENGLNGQVQPAFADLRAETGLRHLLPALPLALLYSLLGVSDFSTFLISILAILLSCALIFWAAVDIYGRGAASLAAFMWVALPATLLAASSFLYVPITVCLFLIGLFFYLRLEHVPTGQFARLGLVLSTVLLLGVFDFVVAMCFLLWAALLHQIQRKKMLISRAWVPFSAIGLVLAALHTGTGKAFLSFYDSLTRLPEMEVLLPIAYFSLAISVWKFRTQSKPVLAVIGVCFLGLLWRYSHDPQHEIISDPLLLLILAATCLLWGNTLSERLDTSKIFSTQWFSSLLILGVAWGVINGNLMLIPPYTRFDWDLAIPFLNILPGIIFLLLLFSALPNENKPRFAPNLAVLLVALIPLAMVPFLRMRFEQNRQPIVAVAKAMQVLSSMEELPIYVVGDGKLVQQFNYRVLGKKSLPIEYFESAQLIGAKSALIVYWEDAVPVPPSNWWQISRFGGLGGPRLVVARVLEQTQANKVLENASLAVQDAATAIYYHQLYGAAINAGQTCEAIKAWFHLQALSTSFGDYLPLQGFSLHECFDLADTENLLEDLKPLLYGGYTRMEYASHTESLQEGATFGFQYPFFEDPRTFPLETALKPGRIYAYHIELQGPEELMPLYWNIGHYENYLDYGRYRNWTVFTVLFSTFGWDDNPLPATFYPFLYYPEHLGGFTEFKNLALFEVRTEMIK